MVLLVSGWLQTDGRPNRHRRRPAWSTGVLSGLFAVARLMASRRCQNAPRSLRPRDAKGLAKGKGGTRAAGGIKGPRKES